MNSEGHYVDDQFEVTEFLNSVIKELDLTTESMSAKYRYDFNQSHATDQTFLHQQDLQPENQDIGLPFDRLN